MENISLPKAFLIIGGSKVFPLEKPVTRIGRAFENDLMLEYPQISRKHAELRFGLGNYEIIDMESTGGTFVNGKRIDRQILQKGDVITLVNIHLVFGQDDIPDSTTQYQKPKDSSKTGMDTTLLQFKSKDEDKDKGNKGSSF